MNIVRGNPGTVPNSQAPSSNFIPADLAALVDYLQPQIAKFRDSSSPLNIMLETKEIKIGSSSNFRISSVGLGEKTIHKVVATISLKNQAGAAQPVQLSSEFPFNLISSVNTQINGNTSVSNASPLAYLYEMARRNRNLNLNPLNTRICKLTAGANLTLTAAPANSPSLSGYSAVSIAANQTGILTVEFYFEVPYTLNKEQLIGLLPLQNNSMYATITYNAASAMIGTDPTTPLYVAGAVPGTLTFDVANTSMNVTSRYDYWSVPGDFALYQSLIMNSFQIIEQPGNTFQASGTSGLKFQFPLNSYLLAAGFVVRDSGGILVNAKNVFSSIRLEYNGNIYPFKTDFGIHDFDQFMTYGSQNFSALGTLLWDGTATDDRLNTSDSAGWMDLYNTSNPTFYADVNPGSIALPASYSFIRTQIVPSDVRVIPNG